MDNLVKNLPHYKKRKRLVLLVYFLLVVGYTSLNIYWGLAIIFQIIVIIVLVSLMSFMYIRCDEIFAKKTKKNFYKQEVHKAFIGKRTFTFNEEFIDINEKSYKWIDCTLVDTDDLYVFMYFNGYEKVAMFPKYPKDLPLEERNKLDQLIQARFNVNIS